MKIRIKRANTVFASVSVLDSFTHGVIDYIDELRQHAEWESEK